MRKILFIIPFFLWTCSESKKPTEPSIPIDTKPIAQNIQIITEEFTSVNFTLSASDVLNRELYYQYYTDPSHGDLNCCTENTGTYYPYEFYHGFDSFQYVAITSDGYISEPAEVNISITPKNYKALKNVQFYNGGNFATFSDAVIDIDGIVIIGDFRQSQQPDKLYILKVDYEGNLIWENTIQDSYSAKSIKILNGNYIVSTGNSSDEGKMFSFSSTGVLNWSKETSLANVRVGVNEKNNLIITYQPRDPPSPSSPKGFYIKASDEQGNEVWTKEITTNENIFNIREIIESNENEDGFLLVGQDGVNPLVIKIDISGEVIWRNQYSSFTGGAFNITNYGENFLIVGFDESSQSGSWYRAGLSFEIDSNGNLIWSKTYDNYQVDSSSDSKHSHLSHIIVNSDQSSSVAVGYGPVGMHDGRLMFIYEDFNDESSSFIKGLQNEVSSYEYYVQQSHSNGGLNEYRIFEVSSDNYVVISTTTMNYRIFVATLNLDDANY